MNDKLEAKVKSIMDKLIASRKKHVGDRKSGRHVANKISRALEDSLRGKDDVLQKASQSQRAILDRTMMETFEFLGDPTKEAKDYQKIMLEQLERIHASNDKNDDKDAGDAIAKLIEKQIRASKELKLSDGGIGKAVGGIFFNDELSKDIDALGEKFEKLINGGGLFGSTQRKIDQATLRGKAAKEMKDIGLRDPFHTHEHDDEIYYRHRGQTGGNQGYSGGNQQGPSNPSSGNGGGSSAIPSPASQPSQTEKLTPEEGQSSYKMKSDQGITDVEPKAQKMKADEFQSSFKMSPKEGVTDVPFREVKIDKLSVNQIIAKAMTFGSNRKQGLLPQPKPRSLLGYDKKQNVTDAIIKRETIDPLKGLSDNEGDKMDALENSAQPKEPSSPLSDAALIEGGKGLLKGAGKMIKGAAGYALPAAAMVAAGAGVDYVAGQFGVGGKQIDEKQDDANWDKMTWSQKIESGLARGTEKVGSALFLDNFANEARAKRIKTETEYLNKSSPASVSSSGVNLIESASNAVEQSADKRMNENSQPAPVIVNNTTNNSVQGGEKKTDIPPAPANSRPTESTFTYWQRNVFLK